VRRAGVDALASGCNTFVVAREGAVRGVGGATSTAGQRNGLERPGTPRRRRDGRMWPDVAGLCHPLPVSTQRASGKRAKIGPEARLSALVLLADGYTVAAAARKLSLRRQTLQAWRDSIDGQRQLRDLRAEREKALRDASADALRLLRSGAERAAQVLVDTLEHAQPSERVRAAMAILDRVGVVRTTRVETVDASGEDLSRLSDEELATYEALCMKVRAPASPLA
jgi:hypothetical protein